ncbi:hypothetical protein VIBNIAM115_1200031 [Vibrio nigripulchritudo AM115]|nr:hypothetical protein VIBNIAM115_1200031 [Vibrio nigripulchritudo AM115]
MLINDGKYISASWNALADSLNENTVKHKELYPLLSIYLKYRKHHLNENS